MTVQPLPRQAPQTPAAKHRNDAPTKPYTLWGAICRTSISTNMRPVAGMDRKVHRAIPDLWVCARDAMSRKITNNYTHTVKLGMPPVLSKIGAIPC